MIVRTRVARAAVAVLAVSAAVVVAVPAGSAGTVAAGAAAVGAVDGRPNVVLIVTDDQTVENLRVMTFVDEHLVPRATTFTNAAVSFPVCCPSRATILTGQYAHNHGVLGNHWPRGGYLAFDDSSTLATWLDGAGYFTSFTGRYLNEYGAGHEIPPVPPGWDDWFAKFGAGDVYYRYEVLDDGEVRAYGSAPEDYATDVYAAHAAEVILGRAGDDTPFFLEIAPTAPHGADGNRATPAPRHDGAYADEPLPRPPSFDEADVSDKPERIRSMPRLGPEAVADIEARYRERLEAMLAVDDLVATVVAALKAIGEYDETIVVFTSDNGFLEGQHRIVQGKVLPYEEAVLVPLLVAGPGFPRRTRVSVPVANIDIAPTIAAAAGVEPALEVDGVPLQDVVADPVAFVDRPLLLEAFGQEAYAGVRADGWQYVEYDDGERELYDLRRDPYQLVSQHAKASLAPLRATLAAELARLRTCAGASCRAAEAGG